MESGIWVAVKTENADMLTTDVYNMFLFLPVYMGMYYGSDLHICGSVSKKLYRNVLDYLIPILSSFSDKLTPINVTVDGFKESDGEHKIVGTGISCGVDSLATIYKYACQEEDPDYKLNGLFMLNCGWHGKYGDPKTIEIFEERCVPNRKAAAELNLPFYMVDSNMHAFLPYLDDQISYFYIYTCVFALEKALNKYYISSSYSYSEVLHYGYASRNRDWSEYGDPMGLPLMQSEKMCLISDGCQYSRTKKTELISDWEITQKYLNVCCVNDSVENCSICTKCTRTLLALDAMGKLDTFSNLFDIEKYRKEERKLKCDMVWAGMREEKTNVFLKDNYYFSKEKGVKLPSMPVVIIYKVIKKVKRIFRK